MKKIFLIFIIFTLTSCSKNTLKTPNELILKIKDYECNLDICYFSNKNSNTYSATQSYNSSGKYFMEFLDSENLKISYENSNLTISSNSPEILLKENNYIELNENPLFLSYFINTYFNTEDSTKIKSDVNSIQLTLPDNNPYLHTAKLVFNNNLPYSLTYFDKNGNEKINIIYNEFTFI